MVSRDKLSWLAVGGRKIWTFYRARTNLNRFYFFHEISILSIVKISLKFPIGFRVQITNGTFSYFYIRNVLVIFFSGKISTKIIRLRIICWSALNMFAQFYIWKTKCESTLFPSLYGNKLYFKMDSNSWKWTLWLHEKVSKVATTPSEVRLAEIYPSDTLCSK